MQDDLIYYKQRTVQISSKEPSGALPGEHSLRSSLASFGDIWHFQSFCTREQGDASGSPDTAIVVFSHQAAVKNTLGSSRNESTGSFWRTDSVKAHTLKKTGPVYEAFLTEIIPRLRQESHVPPSGSDASLYLSESKPSTLSLEGGPPLKRPRAEDWGVTPHGSAAPHNCASTSRSSRTPSAIPDSTEWMRARIAHLEAELGAARAARDMSISEQDVLRVAYEAEQRARREAMSQKSAAQVALSQAEVEQDRLRAALGAKLSIERAQSIDTEGLYGTDYDVKPSQPQTDYDVKPSQPQSEETQGRVHNTHLEEFHTEERQKMQSDTNELDEAKITIRRLHSDFQKLKFELASTQGQLESTQCSLDSVTRKHSSTLEEYKGAKEELETYKLKLENEQMLMKKLKDKLIPEVHKSLGATNETLKAFLSTMEQPPASKADSSK
ncbi:unnamed protein product [Rhizoctonia solani]|uniref:Uncharacterized protein n=1 Tax=Rhizoctonia solani TaxID=456999 RepID=A0A8H3BFI7_9AGAM|nr:unnamed protein product [Rhizoctonia solani]